MVSGVAVATGTLYAIGGPGRDAVTVVRQFGAFRVVGLGGLRTLAAGDVTGDGEVDLPDLPLFAGAWGGP